jgi:PKHD-type hydroxylase
MLYKNYYYYFKEVIPKHICNNIVKYALTKDSKVGIIGDVEKANLKSKKYVLNLQKVRNSNIVWLREPWLYNQIMPFVHEANRHAGWNFDFDFSEDCQFTIYNKDQFYDWHVDSYVQKDVYATQEKVRKLSVTLSLSPSSSYKGGELEFIFPKENILDKKSKSVVCKEIKEQGSLVVFPSYIHHRVKPITKGKRYSLVVWNKGYPFR